MVFASEVLRSFLLRKQIATLEELKQALGTTSTMTVFRKLKNLGYRTSYSHRGKYYTLAEIPQFDEPGLWSCRAVWFSREGTCWPRRNVSWNKPRRGSRPASCRPY